jgi:TPR repeat protein
MRKPVIITITLVLMASCGSEAPVNNMQANEQPRAGNDFYALTDKEIAEKTQSANQGNGDAAFALSQYYRLVRRDVTNADLWLQVAVKNGNTVAKYNMAVYLLADGRSDADKQQAKILLQEAAQAGDQKAADRLKAMEGKVGESKTPPPTTK